MKYIKCTDCHYCTRNTFRFWLWGYGMPGNAWTCSYPGLNYDHCGCNRIGHPSSTVCGFSAKYFKQH